MLGGLVPTTPPSPWANLLSTSLGLEQDSRASPTLPLFGNDFRTIEDYI